jgi:hypothetical protein
MENHIEAIAEAKIAEALKRGTKRSAARSQQGRHKAGTRRGTPSASSNNYIFGIAVK